MSIEAAQIKLARSRVLKWLNGGSVDALPDQSASLSERFMVVARRAHFGMGITVSNSRYKAVWTHPRISGSQLPDIESAADAEDARILACDALLNDRECARMLDQHRPPPSHDPD
jgi:hypothetical protein